MLAQVLSHCFCPSEIGWCYLFNLQIFSDQTLPCPAIFLMQINLVHWSVSINLLNEALLAIPVVTFRLVQIQDTDWEFFPWRSSLVALVQARNYYMSFTEGPPSSVEVPVGTQVDCFFLHILPQVRQQTNLSRRSTGKQYMPHCLLCTVLGEVVP